MTQDKIIIIVDEDRLFTDLITNSLASDKCEVVQANSVAEAKTLIVQHGQSLVIANAHLADAVGFIMGLQVVKSPVLALVNSDRLRDQLRLAEIPVVDRHSGFAALVDAIRQTIGLEINAGAAKPSHVLIVDDEEEVRSLLSDFLTERGYITSVARNGVEAVRAIQSDPRIAVVLLDLVMPRQSGLETIMQIMSHRPHPGVIMLSGTGDKDIAQRALKLGAFGWIVKPPDLSEVEATVSACIACSEMAS